LPSSWQAADDGSNTAYAFNFGIGQQLIRSSTLAGRVLLVHAGELGATSPVHARPSLPLVLTAGTLAAALRRRIAGR
jgi:hypothetical protein